MEFQRRQSGAVSTAAIESIQSRFGFSEPFAAMLARRGLVDDVSITAFLHAETQPLPDPFALNDMDRAIARIRYAIDVGERICVYGDYDTDGVCATAILLDALKVLGANVCYLLPDRRSGGYGLNPHAVDTMKADGVRLIVTVDNGVSAHAEIACAKKLGIDTVVTDHHRCHETLPDACAIVCASREGQDPALHCLCGAAVSMLVAQALGAQIGKYLPIAALATMADVVPLHAYNRTIVKKGLPLVQTQQGLRALLDAAGVTEVSGENTLSFLLAPRINAAGRMGDASRAVRLLMTENADERASIAAELERENLARRAEELRILKEAETQITEPDPNILILKGADWNPGVIGIVASRLAEKRHCPVFLFTEADGTPVGSGRSVPAVDLFALLTRHKELFTRYGGHRLAAGASLPAERFETMKAALSDDLAAAFPSGLPEEPIAYEDELPLSALTVAFARELTLLRPFGEENRAPLFRVKGTLSMVRTMGRDGAHLSARLSDATASVRLAAFGMGEKVSDWSALSEAEALVCAELGSYLGREEVTIRVEALRAPIDEAVSEAISRCIRAIKSGSALPDQETLSLLLKVSEPEIRTIYRSLSERLKTGVSRDGLTAREQTALLPLLEIGVVRFENGRFLLEPVQEKRRIQNALLYPVLCLE